MIKPKQLNKGDTFAAISLSSGMAGDKGILWRYNQGKKQLEGLGFNVVESEHSLKGSEFIYTHPKERAQDLERALLDPKVDAIIANIGGVESYRIFEYLDLEILRENPKIMIGYSDTTSIHQMFRMAGIVSFYGPCVLVDMAENGGIDDVTKDSFESILMQESTNYTYPWRKQWTSEFLSWDIENKDKTRQYLTDEGPILLQGEGFIEGKLIGGCLEVFSMLRGTPLYPKLEDFKDSILLLETSESQLDPMLVESELRTMGIIGILSVVKGIIFGKPQDNKHFESYQESIVKVMKEFGLVTLPVVYNCPFGHTEPKWTLPLGIKARLDTQEMTLTLLESATLNIE